MMPLIVRNWIIKLAKSYAPEVSFSSGSRRDFFGTPSDQNLSKNLEAIRWALWPYVCIRKIANSIAGLNMRFYVGYGEDKEEVFDHPIQNLFFRPNPTDTHRDLWIDCVWNILACGGAYLHLDQLSMSHKVIPGKTKIWTLPTDKIEPKIDKEQGITDYLLSTDTGQKYSYPAWQIIRFKEFNPQNQYVGLAAMTVAERTLQSDFYAREWNRRFFKNDASAGTELTTEQKFDEAADKRIREKWNEEHQGVEKAHRLALFWNGMKRTGDSKRNPKDLDFLNLIKLNREEIIALFGTPPAEVGLFEYANYANALVQKKMFWTDTIIPFLLHLETTLNELAFPRLTDEELWIEFDISHIEVLQEDRLQRAQIDRINWVSNIMTINELRQEHNLEPREDGDILYKDTVLGPGAFGPGQSATLPSRISRKEHDLRLAAWWKRESLRRRWEGLMMDEAKEFFREQRARVLTKISQLNPERPIGESDLAQIFNRTSEEDALEKRMGPFIASAIKAAGQEGMNEAHRQKSLRRHKSRPVISHGVKQDEIEAEMIGLFDVNSADVVAWIQRRTGLLVSNVTDTTMKKIRALVDQAYDEGWSVQRLKDTLADPAFAGFSNGRAYTIAETEMGSAMNCGALMGYQQEGINGKGWMATPDDKVRPEHMAADEAGPIPINEKFKVGGELLDCPGDPNGSAEMTCNCRCSIYAAMLEGTGGQEE